MIRHRLAIEVSMQINQAAIQRKTEECIEKAEALFGIKMPDVEILFNLRGRCAGIAGMARSTSSGFKIGFYIRYNTNFIKLGGKTAEHLLEATVPHEVAHIVCMANPKLGKGHDKGWKRVCAALGGNANRCYSENDAPEAVALNRPFVYTTDLGFEVKVSKTIHNKIQKGAAYIYRGKGRVSQTSKFVLGVVA
jgi:predicted SprT family Zn-dependent metalloprotease